MLKETRETSTCTSTLCRSTVPKTAADTETGSRTYRRMGEVWHSVTRESEVAQ